jgi:hypothetical protein
MKKLVMLSIAVGACFLATGATADPETSPAPSGVEETETFVFPDGTSLSMPGADANDDGTDPQSLDFSDGWDETAPDNDTKVTFVEPDTDTDTDTDTDIDADADADLDADADPEAS